MKSTSKTKQELLIEIEELRARLDEAEETLQAIRSGEVDGLVVSTPEGERVFTLAGADYPYRALIEQMNEGAFTMASDGTILYCNSRFAEMIKRPLEMVINSSFFQYVEPRDKAAVYTIIREDRKEKRRIEISLTTEARSTVPAYLSINFIDMGDMRAICAVVTDLTEQKNNEEILKAARLARSILDQSSEAIIICDENGRIIQTSQVGHRYFGAILLRQPFDSVCSLSIASPSPLQPKQFSISSVLSGKVIRSLEVTRRRDDTADTQESYFLLNARPLIHNAKRILGCVVSLTDITERKRAEEAAKLSEKRAFDQAARLQTVLDTTPAIIWIASDRECREITGNRTSYVFLRVPEGTDMSKSGPAPEHLVHYRVLKDGVELTAQEMPIQRVAASGQGLSDYAMELVFDDGTVRSVLGNISPVLDAAGQPNGAIAAFIDITAHQETEMKYSKILATALSGFWITDVQSKLLEVNDALCRMLGYTREELLDLSIADVEADESPADVLNHISALQQKKSDYFVTRHRRKDGSIIDVEVNSTWLDLGEGRLVGFMQDITERKRMEEELRKSRDSLEIRVQERTREVREQSRILDSFFKFSITPFVILDKDFNFIRVNEAYAKACHREASEFLGHNHFEFYPSDAKVKFEEVVRTKQPFVASARPFSFPDHPGRGVTYWDWVLTPILDDAGEVVYLVFSLEEVTNRKRADEAIKRERQRFYDVLEMLPAYLVLLAPDYHVPFANRFFRERFGESHGNRCFEYLFGRSEPCEICETYTALKTIAPHHWEWTGPDSHIYDVFDYPFTETDGSTLILEMGIDITERKQAEEALRAAHQYNRSLIEASLDPLVTINAEGKVTDVNTATELATGVTREQLIGSDFSDYFTEPERAREGYRTAFLKGTVRDYPLAIRHRSGIVTEVLYNATIYRNEAGEIQGVFAAARDITKRKRAEEALRESEARLRVLSSQLLTAQESERKRIALELHDGIGQMLTALKFKVENTVQEMGKGKARQKSKSLEALIPMIKNTIEEVRRMQMDLRPSTLDDLGLLATLGWFCREYQKIYSHVRIEREISIQEEEVPILLKVVLYRLTQEAMNNVAKHSQADLLRLSLGRREDKIEWRIEDNGTGFDLEETLSPKGAKQGLGLGSMKERTELSGGTFVIESIKGKGTTVRASWAL